MFISSVRYNSEYLPAATKLGQGNIFTSVCQEFCPQGGRGSASVHAGIHHPPPWTSQADTPPPDQADPPWSRRPPGAGDLPRTRQTPPGAGDPPRPGRPPLEQADPPGPGRPPPSEADCSIRSTSGRYASYWNAFLLCIGIE